MDPNRANDYLDEISAFCGLKVVLRDINLDVKSGMKVCLVGPPGSGVSLFFLAIMGEAVLSQGSLKLNGKISYLSKNLSVFIAGTLK